MSMRLGEADGRDFELTGDEHAREVVVAAADSLVDRYDEGVRRCFIGRGV